MKKYKIIGICQIYNELEKGNLKRFIKYIKPLVDDLVIYDDASTDGSFEYILKHTPYVIRGSKNDFSDEIHHRSLMLKKAIRLKADFILWLDADEVITGNAREKLLDLCQEMDKNQLDAIDFHEINLWRSKTYQRTDSLYNLGWFPRLWRVTPDLSFKKTKKGLHQVEFIPSSIKKRKRTNKLQVLHYGFADKLNLAYKYLTYRLHGQKGYEMLDRLISEEKLKLQKVPPELFPDELYQKGEVPPAPFTFEESLAYIEEYKAQVFRPKYSIACLIYKSVDWLKFIHKQVLKYTDLADKEFYFVANDATPEVLKYLKDNYLPHYIFRNSENQKKEWYINNVYRAWNYAAEVAKGDFIVFINSDMAFSENWFEELLKSYNGRNCVASRLVESGKLKSGIYGIEKNFGLTPSSYKEEGFQTYSKLVAEKKLVDGGLYMPLLIRKKDFQGVGGYPEGNVVPKSDIFHPRIAEEGQKIVSGDTILMEKLKTRGISHQTTFSSVVYHFQCGEMDEKRVKNHGDENVSIAICNDLVAGTMGEKVLWDYLLESLPGAFGVDKRVVGGGRSFEKKAKNYIDKGYPNTGIIIQNATFMGTIDAKRYTVSLLQDNLRSMKRESLQQEANLKLSNKIVANSINTASSYRDYAAEIIPLGVDRNLFRPLSKRSLRKKHEFTSRRIGIFVGNFSEVKGWSKVKACIRKHPEITWILVTKYNETFKAKNVRVYSKIRQELLTELLNCADFFIIGSKVETQCLAAIEACLCNTPVIMMNVGIFKSFSEEERNRVGIFGEDFELAIKQIFAKHFAPRNIILKKKLTIESSMEKWRDLLQKTLLEINAKKLRIVSDKVAEDKGTYYRYAIELYFRKRILKKFFKKEELGINKYLSKNGMKEIAYRILKRTGMLPVIKRLFRMS